jgi:hypothetical protein
MKGKKFLVVGMLLAVMSLALVGCGGGGSSATEGSLVQSIATSTESSAAAEATTGTTATSGTATEAATTVQTVEQMASAQIAEEADTSMKADDLIGSWVDVTDSTRFANIVKDGENYTYEDNDGKYKASFKDAVLKVEVAANDFAEVYIDSASGHLMLVYQDNVSEFSKK